MSKISVALCTYNGARFLPEQLESILQQSRLPDEIIVGDDCSTDATVSILENFAVSAPFPVFININEKNLGSTKNFERAIMRCSGDLIFLCDQDDVWLWHKIEKSAAILETSPEVGFVFTDAELVDEDLQSLGVNLWQAAFTPDEQGKARAGKMFEVLLRRNVVTGATLAFRAKFRESFTPIPTHLPNVIHDGWIALVITAQVESRFINEPTMKYRIHAGQQLGIDWRNKSRDVSGIEQTRIEEYSASIEVHRKRMKHLQLFADELNSNSFLISHTSKINPFFEQNYQELQETIAHYEMRKNLSQNRLRRIAPIVKEVFNGRYHRFSKGFQSAAKDFFDQL